MNNHPMNKTFSQSEAAVQPKWFVVDAAGLVLGRLASKVAQILSGKNKASYTPHIDTGDYVIIINAEKVALTGNKATDKIYHWHTFYTGGYRERTAKEMLTKHPERIVEHAIRGMLPKTKLGRKMYLKLKVFAGTEHPHAAQKPEIIVL